MADGSLALDSNPRNDILRLVRYLSSVFHYCHTETVITDDYVCVLKTMVGLGYTAVLVNNGLPLYKKPLQRFLQYPLHCFTDYQGDLSELATAVAQLMNIAFESFEELYFTDYYGSFISSVYQVLDHELLWPLKKRREARDLFHKLIQKRS